MDCNIKWSLKESMVIHRVIYRSEFSIIKQSILSLYLLHLGLYRLNAELRNSNIFEIVFKLVESNNCFIYLVGKLFLLLLNRAVFKIKSQFSSKFPVLVQSDNTN
jgi:hypothetical protein